MGFCAVYPRMRLGPSINSPSLLPLACPAHLWPWKVRSGWAVWRRSYRYTLWSADPTASSWQEPGRQRTAHTLARVSTCGNERRGRAGQGREGGGRAGSGKSAVDVKPTSMQVQQTGRLSRPQGSGSRILPQSCPPRAPSPPTCATEEAQFVLQNFTAQSSDPEASSVGSASQKSTDQMRLEWASNSFNRAPVLTSHTLTTPAQPRQQEGGGSRLAVQQVGGACNTRQRLRRGIRLHKGRPVRNHSAA